MRRRGSDFSVPMRHRAMSMGRLLAYAVGGLVVAGFFAAFAWRLYSYGATVTDPDLPPLPSEEVAPMPRPALVEAPALPLEAELVAARSAADDLVGETLPLWAEGVDAASLAWATQAAAADKPARVGAWELYRGRLHLGQPVLIKGRVADPGPAAAPARWRRALIELDERVWVEAVCPLAMELPPEAELSGRFLGLDDVPGDGGRCRVAALLVQAVRPGTPGIAGSRLDGTAPDPAADAVWSVVDDQATVLERDPYYALLDLVAREPAAPSAGSEPPMLNALAGKVWEDPARYRGRPVRVTGRVLRAWEDRLVAADHPHGVTRVVRVLAYHRDFGPLARIGKDGKAVITEMSALHLYELALVGDLPLPLPGQQLLASGRFLKINARPIDVAAAKPGTAHSDRAFALFVVAKRWEVLPERALSQLPLWRGGVVVVSSLLATALLWFGWLQLREHRALAARLAAGRSRREEVAAFATASPAAPSVAPDPPPVEP